MKVRACVTAAVIAAGISWSAAAGAQEAAKEAPRVDIVDVAQFFTAPRALGDAWERALRAVLDGMRALVDAERTAARQALAPAPPAKRAPAWTAVVPAVREVGQARRIVAVHPVTVEPVTETVADVRGQRAVLLGASVGLPWNVP
jgi:hypothetical protein